MLIQQQQGQAPGGAIQIGPEIIQYLQSMGISDPSVLSQQNIIDLLVKSGEIQFSGPDQFGNQIQSSYHPAGALTSFQNGQQLIPVNGEYQTMS